MGAPEATRRVDSCVPILKQVMRTRSGVTAQRHAAAHSCRSCAGVRRPGRSAPYVLPCRGVGRYNWALYLSSTTSQGGSQRGYRPQTTGIHANEMPRERPASGQQVCLTWRGETETANIPRRLLCSITQRPPPAPHPAALPPVPGGGRAEPCSGSAVFLPRLYHTNMRLGLCGWCGR